MAKATDLTRLKCQYCSTDKIIVEYYKTKSKMFTEQKYIPICKKCITELFNELRKKYEKDDLAFLHICMFLDVPLDFNLFEDLNKVDKSRSIILYMDSISKKTLKKQFHSANEKSISNVIAYMESLGNSRLKEKGIPEDFAITTKIISRWGTGHNIEDYYMLEVEYNKLAKEYGGKTPVEETLYKDIAITELNKRKALLAGDDATHLKYLKAQSTLLGDSKLKPSQNKALENEDWCIGTFIKGIEDRMPVPVADEKYHDVDGIKKIMKEHYVDQLQRSMGRIG